MINSKLSGQRIAIVGGGIAGVTAADYLMETGASVTLFEKSRGLGGRLATRRFESGATADHGAQFITARSNAFRAFIENGLHQNTFDTWKPHVVDSGGATQRRDQEIWYCGTPAMNTALKTGLIGPDIRLSTHVTAVSAQQSGVLIEVKEGETEAFDRVIVAVPAPQAAELVRTGHPELACQITPVSVAPCWTLMLVFDTRLSLGFDVWRNDQSVVAWAARNSSKKGRDFEGESWTVQASADWSAENLECEKGHAASEMLTAFEEITGRKLPLYVESAVHRWRYAKTTNALGRPFLKNARNNLYVAGDWCLGARVECGFESGLKAAKDMSLAVQF